MHIEKCKAQLSNTQAINRLTIMWMECDKQRNTSDCGIFAIANIVALLFKKDPLSITFDAKDMRSHLLACLEKGQLTPFPMKRTKRKGASLSGSYLPYYFSWYAVAKCQVGIAASNSNAQCARSSSSRNAKG